MHMPLFRAGILAAAILATPMLAEARRLDPLLESMLPTVAADETVEVIVSFDGDGPASASRRATWAA
jgi:serine protease AprX